MQKDLNFTIETEGNVSQYVLADPDKIRQVLQNLVSNTFNFTDHGWVHTKVKVLSETQTQIKVHISILIPELASRNL